MDNIKKVPFKNGTIELVVGNIVEQNTDAIVNAANTKLAGGGGVDGAIHRAAGPKLLEQCLKFPADEKGIRCPTAEVRTTTAANMKCKYVIHAVGPFYNAKYKENGQKQLTQVHQHALEAVIAHDCKSVAFPAISTGAYRFPLSDAAEIAIGTVADFLESNKGIDLVRFVLFEKAAFDVFQSALVARKATC